MSAFNPFGNLSWWQAMWLRWRSLPNVPFRKSWFIGFDLEGNTYWELLNRNNPNRTRRMARPPGRMSPQYHMADFRPPPQWVQWLRHTRAKAPTLEELMNDLRRQQRVRMLAKQADEKWKSIPLKDSAPGLGSADVDPRLATAWTPGNTKPESPVESTAPSAQQVAQDPVLQAQHRMIEAQQRIHMEEQRKKAEKKQAEKEQTEKEQTEKKQTGTKQTETKQTR